jgi:hypothetical protein
MKLFFAALLFISSSVFANNSIIEKEISDYKLIGEHRFRFIFLSVYDAKLYSPSEVFSKEEPFVLKLNYLIGLDGKKIAQRSIKEMQKQGFKNKKKLEYWLKIMINIFPNIKNGDSLIGKKDKNSYTQFYSNGEFIGIVKDKEFSEWFFNIWLGKKTSEQKMRRKLLGVG